MLVWGKRKDVCNSETHVGEGEYSGQKKGGARFRKKTEELSVGAGCRKNPGNWWKLGVSGQREIGKARLRRCEARKGD